MKKIEYLKFKKDARNSKNLKKGLTLPELLVSTAILAGALIATVFLLTNCMIANDTNRGLILAMNHAQYILEDIRNTSFASISSGISSGTWNLNAAAVTAAGLTALKNESITTTSSGSNPLDITVTVTWVNRKQISMSRSLKTLISN